MSRFSATALLAATLGTAVPAQTVPDNLVADGIPAIPASLRRQVSPYLEFRTASFQSWHPQRREMLIATRFAETMQLHRVRTPGGAREQLTFLPEPVAGGGYQPKQGRYIVFGQDTGGGEFFQYYRFEPGQPAPVLLTDGTSRNTGARWSDSGTWLIYSSTRRNGKDTDLYLMNPADPKGTDRLVKELSGGGWTASSWSPDEKTVIVQEYVSINESHLHLLDLASGRMTPLTPAGEKGVSWADAEFSRDGKSVYATTDRNSEFHRLVRMDRTSGEVTVLTPDLKWDVASFDLSPDGRTLALVANEDGASVLHLMESQTGKERPVPRLPVGVITGLSWHENSRDLGFTLSYAQSPADAHSLDVETGDLTRWTFSETGGLDATQFRSPEWIRVKSFDGLAVSGFAYRPDPVKFPGRRPVLIYIHGGPESQSLPTFQGRMNYYLDELGVALVVPNVRGSSGYGKTFLTLDNGMKREDSVKDIGAFLDWIATQSSLDAGRVAVMGGSYGGYMTLASVVHFSNRLRCGVDVVGISSFLTFLKNTQDYRRDLRRVEYGDERDPEMRAFMERTAPLNNVARMKVPLLVVQGANDPRVPLSEAEQMVKALRTNGGTCWYLMARDEGHGFAKKRNADFQFLATIQFLSEFLLR